MSARTAVLLALLFPGVAATQVPTTSPVTVTAERLLAPNAGEWLLHGRTYDNQRYSPLAQITTANVARLVPQWIFQLGGARPEGIEATPIVADGVMYLTSAYNGAWAFDLRTRKKLWSYEHKLGK